MGWDGCSAWKSRADVKQDVIAGWTRRGATVLGQYIAGDEFWYVVEEANGERFLALTLIRNEGGWVKKTLSEDEGPYYYECPDSLLALVGPPKTKFAKAWRSRRVVARGAR